MIQVDLDKIITAKALQEHLERILYEVEEEEELFVITKKGRPRAALVNVDYLEEITGRSVAGESHEYENYEQAKPVPKLNTDQSELSDQIKPSGQADNFLSQAAPVSKAVPSNQINQTTGTILPVPPTDFDRGDHLDTEPKTETETEPKLEPEAEPKTEPEELDLPELDIEDLNLDAEELAEPAAVPEPAEPEPRPEPSEPPMLPEPPTTPSPIKITPEEEVSNPTLDLASALEKPPENPPQT